MRPRPWPAPPESGLVWFRRGAIAWVAVVVLSSLGVHAALPDSAKYGVELLLLAPVLVMFASHPEIAARVRGLSPGMRRFVVIWVAVLVLGNVLKQHRVLFPFMGWGMFGRAVSSEPRMVRYTAYRPDGTSFRFIIGGAISDVAVSAIDGALKPLVRAVVQAKDTPERQRAEAALVPVLRGLAQMHEQAGAHPPGPIARVLVEDCRTPLRAPYERRCEPVGVYPVGGYPVGEAR